MNLFFCSFPQDPFKKITYSIIGDDSAPVFFDINKDSGRITLKSSVNGDDQTQYKVQIFKISNMKYKGNVQV